jgi:hypothetical protein
MPRPWWPRRRIDTGCAIEIEQTHDFFHAHLALDGDVEIQPGDRVRVHGAPVRVEFGQRLLERRTATIERANGLTRAWTRALGFFRLDDLYEVTFTPERTL